MVLGGEVLLTRMREAITGEINSEVVIVGKRKRGKERTAFWRVSLLLGLKVLGR